MNTYCIVCKRNTDNVNSKVKKGKNGRLMLLSKRSSCENKKSRFVKKTRSKSNIK